MKRRFMMGLGMVVVCLLALALYGRGDAEPTLVGNMGNDEGMATTNKLATTNKPSATNEVNATNKTGTPNKPKAANERAVTYEADVSIDPEAHQAKGKLIVHFDPKGSEKVYFHLYPNAFQASPRLNHENWRHILGEQREPGGISIRRISVNGTETPVILQGDDNTILEISLASTTGKGMRTKVELQFELQVPKNNGRMSYNDHALWLGNWLPILAVKEDTGWRLDPYYPIGDPFYSQMADYHVRVTIPEEYQLASSGADSLAVITQSRPAKEKLYEIKGQNVRDFALVVMDNTYQHTSSQVGATSVRTWWQEGDNPEQVKRLHEVASESLRFFSGQFAAYPSPEYDLVKTGGMFGGMEYPGLVFIQAEMFREQNGVGLITVAHETGHQWFYGMVGNDEVRESWLDESLTDYITMLFLTRYDSRLANGYVSHRAARAADTQRYAAQGLTVWQSVDRFPNWQSYSDLVYARGAMMLWKLREEWGEELVHRALSDYFSRYQNKEATAKNLIQIFSETAGADATPFFDYWLGLNEAKRKPAEEWMKAGREKR